MRDTIVNEDRRKDDVPPWDVKYTGRAAKQKKDLPLDIANALLALVKELQRYGPVRNNWPHYGKIMGRKKNVDIRHCHLHKGHPTYVAAWKVDKKNKKMEIIHVSTHEKTDYGSLG